MVISDVRIAHLTAYGLGNLKRLSTLLPIFVFSRFLYFVVYSVYSLICILMYVSLNVEGEDVIRFKPMVWLVVAFVCLAYKPEAV